MSFLEGKDVSLLLVEVDGFNHPCFKHIRDFLHQVDHGGELGV